MRFIVLLAATFLFTLVSGLAVPHVKRSETDLDLETRQFIEDVVELYVRKGTGSKKPKNQYVVPGSAAQGKPALTYSKSDVKAAVAAARIAHANPPTSKTQQKKALLKPFSNSDHRQPQPGGPTKSLPKMVGPGFEYPLRNAAQGPATYKDKGPARVIMQPNAAGKLKFKGVVAHDQSRPDGSLGYNDHFKIKGTN